MPSEIGDPEGTTPQYVTDQVHSALKESSAICEPRLTRGSMLAHVVIQKMDQGSSISGKSVAQRKEPQDQLLINHPFPRPDDIQALPERAILFQLAQQVAEWAHVEPVPDFLCVQC